jgi:hypothetical protein
MVLNHFETRQLFDAAVEAVLDAWRAARRFTAEVEDPASVRVQLQSPVASTDEAS